MHYRAHLKFHNVILGWTEVVCIIGWEELSGGMWHMNFSFSFFCHNNNYELVLWVVVDLHFHGISW